MIEEPTIGMLGTVSGVGLVISIVTEVIFRAWRPDADTKDRFGPLVALAVGELASVAGAFVLGSDLIVGFLVGLVAAGVAMGVRDTVAGPVAAMVAPK